METKLIIVGEPMGKQRPRSSKFGMYTPKETIDYEKFVKYCYYGHPHFEDKIVAVDLDIILPIPSSISKKKRLEMIAGRVRPSKKPDIDNVIKIILDGLNGVAWNDDKQVCEINARKYYGTDPRVELKIRDIFYEGDINNIK